MSIHSFETKVFALSTLIFHIFSTASGQSDSIYRLPPGTRITVKMDREINSASASAGDTFAVTVSKPVANRGVVVLPAGAKIEGTVTDVVRAGIGNRRGRIKVRFGTLFLDRGQTRDISAVIKDPKRAGSNAVSNTVIAIGGLSAGALIGTAVKPGAGSLIGAAIGGGAGAAVALLRKGKRSSILEGEEFEIMLREPLVLPALEY